jgi:hypothetical protein
MAALGSRLFFYAMPEGRATDEELDEVLAPPLCAKMSETVSPPEITVEGERG